MTVPYSHAQSPIVLTSGRPLAGVLAKTLTLTDGTVKTIAWWNYQAGGWDDEFDADLHARPFSELGPTPDGDAARHWAWAVPREALFEPEAVGLVYAIDGNGNLSKVFDSLLWNQLAFAIGLL